MPGPMGGPRAGHVTEKAKDFKGTTKKLIGQYLSKYKIGLIIVIIFAVGSTIFSIIGPKILGDSTGLSSFWVVFAILVGGGVFGVPGMILGVPAFAVIYYIMKELVGHLLRKRNLPDDTKSYIMMTDVDVATNELRYKEIKQESYFKKKKDVTEDETENKNS